jgi:hypothetical protein
MLLSVIVSNQINTICSAPCASEGFWECLIFPDDARAHQQEIHEQQLNAFKVTT